MLAAAVVQHLAQEARLETALAATVAHQARKVLTPQQQIMVVAVAVAAQHKAAQEQTGWFMSDSDKNYCALVANNVVTEIIVADYAWATANLDGDWYDLGGDPLTVAIGWFYQDGQFVAPPESPTPPLTIEE